MLFINTLILRTSKGFVADKHKGDLISGRMITFCDKKFILLTWKSEKVPIITRWQKGCFT